jgi:hypothetical protein
MNQRREQDTVGTGLMIVSLGMHESEEWEADLGRLAVSPWTWSPYNFQAGAVKTVARRVNGQVKDERDEALLLLSSPPNEA